MAEPGADGLENLENLEQWAAEARARDAAEARTRERWLRTQAEEGARLGAVLAGLAERRADVVVTTSAGHHVTGRVTGVGRDFVAVEASGGRTTLVVLDALAWVREAAGQPAERRRPEPAVGAEPSSFDVDAEETDAGATAGASLVDVLSQAVADRPRLTVHVQGALLSGELRAVGFDLVVLQTSGTPPGLAYLRTRSIYEISFLDSG